jgi:hypothetical protein
MIHVFNICFTVHFYDSTVFTPTNAQFDIYSESTGLHVSAYNDIKMATININIENTLL